MKSDTGTILTVHEQVVTTNPRISVSHDRQHTWSIHIRQLKPSDHGCYMCQLNAKPMRSQMGCVDVQGQNPCCTVMSKVRAHAVR